MAVIECKKKDCKYNSKYGFCRYVGLLKINEKGCCEMYEILENYDGDVE